MERRSCLVVLAIALALGIAACDSTPETTTPTATPTVTPTPTPTVACTGTGDPNATCVGEGTAAAWVCNTGFLGSGTTCLEEVACTNSGMVEYVHPEGISNADCIVPGVCLTRDGTRGLFNAAVEYYYNNQSDASPARTLWTPFECSVANLNPTLFKTLYDATGGSFGNTLTNFGLALCLWLPSEGLMYDVAFSEWGNGNDVSGGTFTYARTAFMPDQCGHKDAKCGKNAAGAVSCICPTGWVNDSTTGVCRKAEPCDPNPCGTGATCAAVGLNDHVCQCDPVTFYKPVTETATVDKITDTVWIARDDEYPIYNTTTESSNRACGNTIGNTEWLRKPCTDATPDKFGLFLDNSSPIPFASCGDLPETLLGYAGCLHLTDSDEYWDIRFNSWCSEGAGGCFGYTRWHGVPDGIACTAFPTVAFSATAVAEAGANDGTITEKVTATVSNDTFSASSGALVLDTDYALSGTAVPTGLTLVVTATSATTAEISFTGTAAAHAAADSVAGIVVTLLKHAYTSGVSPIAGPRSVSLDINFVD